MSMRPPILTISLFPLGSYHSSDVLHSLNLGGVGGRSLGGSGVGGGGGSGSGGGASESIPSSSAAASLPVLDLDFIKRLVHFYKPSSNQFSVISSGREDFNHMAAAGVHLLQYLAEFGGGGGGGGGGAGMYSGA